MRAKKQAFIGFKLTQDAREAIFGSAASQGISVGEYLRRLHEKARATETHEDPDAFPIYNTSDIGPDELWSGQEALLR